MKNCLIYGLFTICYITGAHGACTSVACPTSSNVEIHTMPNNCATYTTACLYDDTNKRYIKYYSCLTCNDPLTLITPGALNDIGLREICGATSTPSYKTCTCGSLCTVTIIQPAATWESGSYGIERSLRSICNESTNCEWSEYYIYRCAAGYYGSPTSGTSGQCQRCPGFNDTYYSSTPGINEAITDCYAIADVARSSTEGTWLYTQDCPYTE